MPTRDEWAAAYAAQCYSDWQVYRLLSNLPGRVETCHPLHYLQMSTEKLAKAFLFRDTETDEDRLQREHVAFSKFIEMFLKSPQVRVWYRKRPGDLLEIAPIAHMLARQIEKLNPAVDRDGSPANVEYPWVDNGQIQVPCNQQYFPQVKLLQTGPGLTFLRLIGRAVEEFEQAHLP